MTLNQADIDKLDAFTLQYIETALWSSNDESTPEGGEPMDDNYGPTDLSPECLAKMVIDCEKFQADNEDLIEQALEKHGQDDSNCGHDFWLTRNGHGCGFWDGDYSDDHGEGPLGKALTEASKAFGETWIYVGDDGQIHSD